ncbi:MAG: GH32 C-terminal domain-containing protein, partial [Oscillospiraceae bacterium]|nr:GH32 C-terminal domain-containing protein [Oscillospiraceae bacterium]
RELRVEGKRLYQAPVREVETIRGAEIRRDAFSVTEGESGMEGVRGGCCELWVTLLPGSAQEAGLKLFRGAAHETLLYFDRDRGCLVLDRSRSGLPITGREADVNRRFCPVEHPEAISLRLFLDRSCLEVFVEQGREVLSANVYPDPEDEGIAFFARGGSAQFRNLIHYELKP